MMRKELKQSAKDFLRRRYWLAFAVSLILTIIGADSRTLEFNFDIGNNTPVINRYVSQPSNDWINEGLSGNLNEEALFRSISPGKYSAVIALVTTSIIIMLLIAMALAVFVFNPLIVGGRRFYINGIDNEQERFGDLGYVFGSGNYLNVVKTLFLRNVFIFLWTLLLIIPGIIKSYAYRFVPYIMAQNPEMSTMRAIELSQEMTDGEKWDMFVLDLSFIGWYLLGALLLGIGTLFVHPYYDATQAQLYTSLRKSALSRKLCTHSELNMEMATFDDSEDDWYAFE